MKKYLAIMVYFWSSTTFALTMLPDVTIDDVALIVSIFATIFTALVNWLYKRREWNILRKKYKRKGKENELGED